MSAAAAVAESVEPLVLDTALQPIVGLEDEHVFAFEALTRVRGGAISPAELFDRRMERRQAARLNLDAIHRALVAAEGLPEDALLFVNADPVVLPRSELPRVVRDGAARAGFPLARLVIEITERSGFTDVNAASRVLGELRAAGVRFALDDFGTAHTHLTLIDVIRPAFVKISQNFGTAFERSATRTHIVRHVAALAHDLACAAVLEGVESPATALAARGLGIEYAQGFFFGRPTVRGGH